jgi:hypothetical protein
VDKNGCAAREDIIRVDSIHTEVVHVGCAGHGCNSDNTYVCVLGSFE